MSNKSLVVDETQTLIDVKPKEDLQISIGTKEQTGTSFPTGFSS